MSYTHITHIIVLKYIGGDISAKRSAKVSSVVDNIIKLLTIPITKGKGHPGRQKKFLCTLNHSEGSYSAHQLNTHAVVVCPYNMI